MSITVGDVTFDKIRHDADADVLYLAVDGVDAAHWEESPEGHVLRYDSLSRLCGITLVGLSHSIGDDGKVTVTMPESVDLRAIEDQLVHA